MDKEKSDLLFSVPGFSIRLTAILSIASLAASCGILNGPLLPVAPVPVALSSQRGREDLS